MTFPRLDLPPWRIWSSTLAILLLAMIGCSPNPDGSENVTAEPTPQDQRLQITATIFPIYLFTQAVAGEAAAVNLLVPPGSEVHEYQSKPTDIQQLAEADVLVKNGLGLEGFLDSTLRSAENSTLVQIDSSQGVQTLDPDRNSGIREEAGSNPQDEVAEHSHEINPHIWLDPVRAQQQVQNIRDGLIQADPNHRAIYEANAAAYLQKLQQLDQQFRQGLQQCQQQSCTFIAFHDAFPYLADRYQLRQVAIVELPEDSLSPGDLQATINLVRQSQVRALFREPGVNNPALANLAQDLNLRLQTLDPLESGPRNPQYYFTAMEQNLNALTRAF